MANVFEMEGEVVECDQVGSGLAYPFADGAQRPGRCVD